MKYKDLRDFIAQLEHQGELKRVAVEIDPHLEMTEICDRVLKAGGPAILFEKPKGHTIPVLGNLFGTPRRVAMGMGQESVEALREVGKLLAYLKEPEPPKGLMDAWEKLPVLKQVLNMAPKELSKASCQEIVWEGKDVDLGRLPIQTCWPGDVGPLITWGLTVTKGPHKTRQNLGIYRQQVIGPQQAHHALAGPSGRRARFSRLLSRQSGPAVSDRGSAGGGPRHYTRCCHAGAGYPERIPVRGTAAGRENRNRQMPEPWFAGSGERRNRAGGIYPTRRD